MKIRELIERLNELDGNDEVVIRVDNDETGESTWYEPVVVGRDGFDEVAEIHLGTLISG